jgi:hypothetical protein
MDWTARRWSPFFLLNKQEKRHVPQSMNPDQMVVSRAQFQFHFWLECTRRVGANERQTTKMQCPTSASTTPTCHQFLHFALRFKFKFNLPSISSSNDCLGVSSGSTSRPGRRPTLHKTRQSTKNLRRNHVDRQSASGVPVGPSGRMDHRT